MTRAKLSAALVENTTCPVGRRRLDLFDEITTGFGCEIRSSKGKTYFFRFFDQSGRLHQLKLGAVGEISFQQARQAAKRLRSEVVLGGNPLAAKQQKKATPTFAQVAEQHIAHAETYQKSAWSVAGIIRKHLLPRWGRYRIDEISSQDVGRFLADKAGEGLKPATVEKIRVVFGRTFELARQWNMAGSQHNPVRGVPRVKFSNARNRYLTAAESARLLRAAERSAQPMIKPILQLLLMTAARKSELLRAEWQHIDLERRSWLIPISKSGVARHIPLSQAAIDVLEGLPRLPGCPYLVPNLETGLPFRDIKKAWDTVRRDAGLPDVRIHDLRHSAASFMINAGVDLYAVGRVLGHADHKSTMRYSHLANHTLLAAVEAGAAGMAGTTKQA